MVHQVTFTPQIPRQQAIAAPAMMLHRQLLQPAAQYHVLLPRRALLQVTVETSPAYLNQVALLFHSQFFAFE